LATRRFDDKVSHNKYQKSRAESSYLQNVTLDLSHVRFVKSLKGLQKWKDKAKSFVRS